MSKLPTVTGKQAIKAFAKAGFEKARQTGSHVILKKPDHKYILTVPCHANTDLKTGTLRSLIKAAGLSIEQFLELL